MGRFWVPPKVWEICQGLRDKTGTPASIPRSPLMPEAGMGLGRVLGVFRGDLVLWAQRYWPPLEVGWGTL